MLRYHKTDEEILRNWMAKPFHGWHRNDIIQDHVNQNTTSIYWLISEKMFPNGRLFTVPTRLFQYSVQNDCVYIGEVMHWQFKESHDFVGKIHALICRVQLIAIVKAINRIPLHFLTEASYFEYTLPRSIDILAAIRNHRTETVYCGLLTLGR